jgi:hypothetical protein
MHGVVQNGRTPLSYAGGHAKVVALLKQHGALR